MMLENSKRFVILPIALLVAALALGLMVPSLIDSVVRMGAQIAEPDMVRDYLVGLIYAIAIGFSILFWPIPKEHQKPLLQLWIVRCFVTLGFMLVYEGHYGLDAFGYYQDATTNQLTIPLEFGDGTALISWLSWWLNHTIVMFDSYHAIKVIYSAVGFFGSYLFYIACVNYLKRERIALLYILNLCPSILFWSSILGKDPLNYFTVCLYTFGVLGWISTHKYKFIIPIILGILLGTTIRPWTGIILVAPLVLLNILKIRGLVGKSVSIGILVVAFLFSSDFLSKRFAVNDADQFVKSSNTISRAWSQGGSGQEAPEFHSVGDMIAFAPVGAFTALFRPLPGEVNNLFGALAGLEDLIILLLVLNGLRKTRLKTFFADPMIVWAVGLILFWSFVYGFVSYQNLGAAVRFKLQICQYYSLQHFT